MVADDEGVLHKDHWSRETIAEKLAEYEQADQGTSSQRQLSQELGIPRTTLQHWLERKEILDVDPAVAVFFGSPAGVAFLRRIVLAAHFVMTLVGPCGIRLVSLLLELSGLDAFVAASYGPQQKVSMAMEQSVVAFGQEEKENLKAGIPSGKQITVCQDETFHPEICLVAIEPVSNYILLEKYADSRTADEWTRSMASATQSLPIEIIQSTSDEGRGILRHVKEDLGVSHSPDVFHVQQGLVQGTSIALANRKRQAEQAVDEAAERVSQTQKKQAAAVNLDQEIEAAQEQERQARQVLETNVQQQQQVSQTIREIGTEYHPYDLETGKPRSAEQLATSLAQRFADIEAVATAANLPERCVKKIHKAKKVILEMVATLAFFWIAVQTKVEALSLAPEVEQIVYNHVIPAMYLHLVAKKTSDPARRSMLHKQSEALLAPALSASGPLAGLQLEEVQVIERVAWECAQCFQRSSSCVEGRNGQLSLRHHSLHRLTDRKLTALTTVHNFFIQRSDGTTPAERFFGTKPRDLFEWLLDRVELPGRPAQKRHQPCRKEFLPQFAS